MGSVPLIVPEATIRLYVPAAIVLSKLTLHAPRAQVPETATDVDEAPLLLMARAAVEPAKVKFPLIVSVPTVPEPVPGCNTLFAAFGMDTVGIVPVPLSVLPLPKVNPVNVLIASNSTGAFAVNVNAPDTTPLKTINPGPAASFPMVVAAANVTVLVKVVFAVDFEWIAPVPSPPPPTVTAFEKVLAHAPAVISAPRAREPGEDIVIGPVPSK